MRALSIWQPQAYCVAAGMKDVENRTWRPPRDIVNEAIAIHASKTYDRAWRELVEREFGIEVPAAKSPVIVHGAVIAVAVIGDIVEAHASKWFTGPFGLVLRHVRAIEPVPLRGMQGLFPVPEDVAAIIAERADLAALPCGLCGEPRGSKGAPFGDVCGACGVRVRSDEHPKQLSLLSEAIAKGRRQ